MSRKENIEKIAKKAVSHWGMDMLVSYAEARMIEYLEGVNDGELAIAWENEGVDGDNPFQEGAE